MTKIEMCSSRRCWLVRDIGGKNVVTFSDVEDADLVRVNRVFEISGVK